MVTWLWGRLATQHKHNGRVQGGSKSHPLKAFSSWAAASCMGAPQQQESMQHPACPPEGIKEHWEMSPAGASLIGLRQGQERWESLPVPAKQQV